MNPVLVGRAAHLDRLTRGVEHLAAGNGTLVHIVGEAGIGKTSLLDEALALVAAHTVPSRRAAADETDRRRPLAIMRALLPEIDTLADPDPISRVIAVVERLTTGGPVALVADDLHWADDASLDALRAVARRAPDLGVLLLTAARPHPRCVALARLEEWVSGHGERLEVEPLSVAELATLVEQRFGRQPGPRLVELLHDTAGNPFLAVEMLDELDRTDAVVPAGELVDVAPGTDLPTRLGQRLARRTFAAVPDGGVVLRAAAVVPGGCSVEELAAVLDRPIPEVLATTMAAIDADILVASDTRLGFRHELLRHAVLDATTEPVLRALHRRVAEVLSERKAVEERVAAALLAGADRDDPADAARLLELGTAMRERNPDAAAELLAAALDAIPLDDPRSEPATLELGWALFDAGRVAEVVPLLAERSRAGAPSRSVDWYRLRGHAISLGGDLDAVVPGALDGFDLFTLVEQAGPTEVDVAGELALRACARRAVGRGRAALHLDRRATGGGLGRGPVVRARSPRLVARTARGHRAGRHGSRGSGRPGGP